MIKLSTAQPFLACLVAGSLLLAGCANQPVEPAPVADRSAAPVLPVAPVAPAATAASTVAPVAAAPQVAVTAGPANAARMVYFDYDSSAIRPEFQALLDQHARYLASRRDRRISIAGHTDERGGREYNLALGQARAEAVRRALQLLGVGPSQMEAISFGEEKPASTGHAESAWQGNRRAELAYR